MWISRVIQRVDKRKVKIFIIHSLGLSKLALQYTKELEKSGGEVFIPCRDTNQKSTENEILETNFSGAKWCDEAHVIWDGTSLGTVFDMGTIYALNKPLKIIKIIPPKQKASYVMHWTKYAMKNEGKYLW